MSDIPEFHGNPNDLDFNPEFVFRLKNRITELEQALNEAAILIEYYANNNVHAPSELDTAYLESDKLTAIAKGYKP